MCLFGWPICLSVSPRLLFSDSGCQLIFLFSCQVTDGSLCIALASVPEVSTVRKLQNAQSLRPCEVTSVGGDRWTGNLILDVVVGQGHAHRQLGLRHLAPFLASCHTREDRD